jgi:hypothetical protein
MSSICGIQGSHVILEFAVMWLTMSLRAIRSAEASTRSRVAVLSSLEFFITVPATRDFRLVTT